MSQRDQEIYKSFLIWAITDRLDTPGVWRAKVNIMRRDGKTIKPFLLNHTLKTEEEAIHHALLYGKLIIDGMIPGCCIEDI